MTDQRPDDETLGRALGRAVESQSVRETPYAASRLATRIDRPARGGWLGTLAPAAAIALFVGIGAFIVTRGPQGVAEPAPPDASATPTVSATSGPPRTPAATPTASPVLAKTRVYFSRDGLPPIGVEAMLAVSADRTAEQRIAARVGALASGLVQPPAGAVNVIDPKHLQNVDSVRVLSGDTALIDLIVSAGGWGVRGAAQTQALLQQLVYTATEEPGILRVRFTENGGKTPTIDQLVLDKPLSREDVAGYSIPAEKSLTIDEEQRAATATTTVSNEVVAPALGRLAIELRPTTPVPGGFWSPPLKVELLPTIPVGESKWALSVTLLGVTDPRAGSLVGAGSLSQVEGSPIRALRVRREANGVTYELYLDDARPWRIGLQRGTNGALVVLVDIGGHPSAIATGTAVYTPGVGATVGRSVTGSGLARAFEATVSWRVRDSAGREVATGFTNASIGTSPYYGTFQFTAQIPASVSGNVTLDVFQASPRDGSDTNKVSIPLQVR